MQPGTIEIDHVTEPFAALGSPQEDVSQIQIAVVYTRVMQLSDGPHRDVQFVRLYGPDIGESLAERHCLFDLFQRQPATE
jgi:hypothetical protein